MSKKPNILFIMCDQMRWDCINTTEDPNKPKTPHLNRLANLGTMFTNAFTPCPICVPARASLTTGCYPHKCTGTKNNAGSIKEGFPLLGETLNKVGYETYAIGKLHYLPYMPPDQPRTTYGITHTEFAESGRILQKYDPQGQETGLEDYFDYLKEVGWGGFTRANGLGNNDIFAAASLVPKEHYVDKWITDRAIHHMDKHLNNDKDNPFFMWASFPKPHSAYDPPKPYDSLYDPREIPAPAGGIEEIIERKLVHHYSKYINYMWNTFSPEAQKTIKAYYYGLITFQDEQIGRLLDFLEENNILEETIIIYTADHGDMLGDHGLYFKSNFYNGSTRIPLLISYPKKTPQHNKSDALVGLQDVLPTIMELIDESMPKAIDGISLKSNMINNSQVRDYYVGQCFDSSQQYMVVDKSWKYIYHEIGGTEELYAADDIHEYTNLASFNDPNYQDILKDKRKILIEWCKAHNDTKMIFDGKLAYREMSLEEKDTLSISPKNLSPHVTGRRWY